MTPPIIHAAVCTAAGAALALRTDAFGAWTLGLAACAVLALLNRRERAWSAAVFLLAGASLGAAEREIASADCRSALQDGDRVVATGRFLTLPDSGARTLLHATSLEGPRTRCTDVVVRMNLRTPLAEGTAGVRVAGEWRRWGDVAIARPERSGVLYARDVTPADVSLALTVRTRLQLGAQARTRALYGSDAPIVEALLLARTETLPREVRERFASSGLVHLLAISGTHVALILGVLLVLASALRMRPPVARACALGGVVAYVMFLGAPPPALRAALQIGLLSVGRALQRPSDSLSAVAVAALVLIGIDPFVVLDVGAQLSFAGVGGIIAFAPAAERSLGRMPRAVARPLAAGMAATATTLPLAGLHFGALAPIGVIASLAGVPLTALAVPAAALPLFISLVSDGLAAFLVPSGRLFVVLLDRVAAAAAAVPGGHSATEPTHVHTLLLAAGAGIIAMRICAGNVARPLQRGRRVGEGVWLGAALSAASGAAAIVFVLAMAAPARNALRGPQVELHMIDVGQGDALAIRSPRGRWLLVDAGARSRTWDAGAARVAPYLKRRRVRDLAGVVITHPDADHIGGVAAAIEAFDVHTVLEPALPAGKPIYLGALAAARIERARWIGAREGMRMTLDGMELQVIYPLRQLDAHTPANDYSAVVLLRFGDFRALLLGDAPTAAEDRIAAMLGAGIRAQVVKIGHHGSATSTGEALLRATQARLALISVGARNRYGHPHPGVLARLARYHVAVLRTDERGAIVVQADRHGRLRVRTDR